MRIAPSSFVNQSLIMFFVILSSCSSKGEKNHVKHEQKSVISKEVIDCQAEKKYGAIIYYDLPQSKSTIVKNAHLSNVFLNHLDKKYIGIKKITDEKLIYLDSSFFAFTCTGDISNCGKLSFLSIIDTATNQVLDTYFIYNEDEEFRWGFYGNTILVYKKIVFNRDEESRKRNCRLSFDFNRNNNITYTLADADERIKW
jgi:hypothetical protein